MPSQTRATILEYQRKNNLPDWVMCNILCFDEEQWQKFKYSYGCALTTFQKIMFIANAETPLE